MKIKRNYRIKEGIKNDIRKHIKFKQLAEIVGVNPCYMSEIMNGRRKSISKTVAFSVCKAISPDLEIEDIFDITEEQI